LLRDCFQLRILLQFVLSEYNFICVLFSGVNYHVCLVQGEESIDKPGSKLYKPSSKLLEKKAATAFKPKEEEKPERPVCTADTVAYLI